MSRKKIVVVLLATVMVATGTSIIPKTAAAGVAVGDTVKYELMSITDYRSEEGENKAPIKNGYVFGGWYKDEEGAEYHTKESLKNKTEAYAKFVPASVLSVKAQNEANTSEGDGVTEVRLLSSVDSENYREIGFHVILNYKKTYTKALSAVYSYITTDEGDKGAADLFHSTATYLSVLRLTSVEDSNDGKPIYVRPYWITMDGTKVEGLAKHVHVEDQYENYISVPVNLATVKEVAAGVVDVSYDSTVFTLVDFERGNIFEEMYANPAIAGSVQMVGNGSDINKSVLADGLYANLRFTVNSGQRENASEQSFTMSGESFCDWDATDVTGITAWDVTYK